MKFYVVDDAYIKHLKAVDPTVMDNYKGKRPYVGIVLEVGGFKYLAPLTSYKRKQDSFKSSLFTLFKLHEKGRPNNKLGMIKLNCMFPLVEGTYQLLDMASQDLHYQNLLGMQIAFISTNQDEVRRRAAKLYHYVTVSKDDFYTRMSCDFKALETGCLSYSQAAKISVASPPPTRSSTAISGGSHAAKPNRPVLTLKSKSSADEAT